MVLTQRYGFIPPSISDKLSIAADGGGVIR
jgi:hypothetical protein